ncbi:unnamed protein product [Ilex paraguariensis]|uniref:RING-type domain-containing protein n=1 Tax=Ilex paraguariensis TaxID=185542 RepID=A0ABC8T5X1_9AQUA
MSMRELRATPITYTRNSRRRKVALDLDLNVLPPSEHRDQERTSVHGGPHDVQAGQQDINLLPAAIDLEVLDDDVIISSPRAFAEAKNNSRRNHERTVVVDVDSGSSELLAEEVLLSLGQRVLQSEEWSSRLTLNNRHKRRRGSANQTIINCDHYINLEGSSNYMKENARNVASPPPPPPKEPTFNCPVCMGPLVEEMSTKCGHIFCKVCIKASIASQRKCPTCRRKVTMKDTIRVYLPAAS